MAPLSTEAQATTLQGLVLGDFAVMTYGFHPLQDSYAHAGKPTVCGVAGHPWGRGGFASHGADHTAEDVERAANAAQATYSYLVAFGNTNPSYRVQRPEFWPSVEMELVEYLSLRNRAEKHAWMAARGVTLPEHYWAEVSPGPNENSMKDRRHKLHLDEQFAKPISQFLSPSLCP